jgi:SAM-dependent methyltransferase
MSTSPFKDAAATWDQRFEGDGYVFGREPNEFLRAQGDRLPSTGRVLCVADGEGRNSVWLARRGLEVVAFDVSKVGVAKARKLAADAGVSVDLQVADADQWAWPIEAFDAVVAIFIQFADPAMRSRLFARMVRALKPGGMLVLQGYTPKQLEYKTGGPGVLANLYTGELLRQEFGALEILELREYEAELSEGARHTGRSALVGLLARRRSATGAAPVAQR